jgi:hypothetical protein
LGGPSFSAPKFVIIPPAATRPLPLVATVLALLALAWICYWPGLDGTFLFDDFVNLNALGAQGPIDNGAALARYLTSATGDPLGRPLSLLSFLIDGRDWPTDAAPFLRTNLVLHLLNGVLLFALLRKLGRLLAEANGTGTRAADWAAVFGMGAWLLHPLLVSTTLYIVQREAMLPTFFSLLGLLAYLRGRERHAAGAGGLGWIAVGIGACGALATLSKANGVLLPFLALALEATVLRANPRLLADLRGNRRLRLWLAFWIGLPVLAVCLYLGNQFLYLNDDITNRPWTRGERLLTQPRMLLDYLWLLLVPRVVTAGLFNDGIAPSTGLLTPLSTLPSLLGVVALLALAFASRRRAPALAAALLFFFAGHLLESSVIALELYFEHRNYLPAMLLFWPIAWWVAHEPRVARARPVVAVLAIAMLAGTLRSRAELWSQPVLQAKLWAAAAPESARAQSHASMLEIAAGQSPQAAQRMRAAWLAQPLSLQVALNFANTACEVDGITPEESLRLADTFRRTPDNGTVAPRWLEKAVGVAAQDQCRGFGLDDVDRFALAALDNPAFNAIPGRRMDLLSVRGLVAIERGEPLHALELFDQALAQWPNASAAARQSAALASRGWPRLGLRHLDYYDTIKDHEARPGPGMDMLRAWVLERQGYWEHEEAELRRKMHEDIDAGLDKGVAPPPLPEAAPARP